VGGWGSPFNIWFYANGSMTLRMDTANGFCQVGGSVPLDNAFHQLSLTYDAGLGKLNAYIDGVGSAYQASCSGPIAIPAANLTLGAFANQNYLQSTLDELRISANVTRTAGWIVTEYNNQKSPATFYSLGVSETNGGVPTVAFSIATAPGGLSVTVDGGACAAPCAVQWTPGTTHTIAATATQAGSAGTQYVFANWSDGGAVSHSVTAPSSP